MILSSFIIGLAFAWLLAETEFLTIQLQAGKTPEPNIETPKRKQRPILEPCTFTQVKTCSYPADDYYYKPYGDFNILDIPESKLGNVNIMCKRC